MTLPDFAYKTIRSQVPAIDEKLNLVADNYAQVSGKTTVHPAKPVKQKFSIKLKEEERQHDIDLTFEFRDIDSVEIDIPPGFVPKQCRSRLAFSNKFGSYKIRLPRTRETKYY